MSKHSSDAGIALAYRRWSLVGVALAQVAKKQAAVFRELFQRARLQPR